MTTDKTNETDAEAGTDGDESKERKTEETAEDEAKDADGDNSTADDATAENATKEEEPPKKKTKMVEKVSYRGCTSRMTLSFQEIQPTHS